jgi:hypothetical protein
MIQPLRSISITETSSLLRANPSLCSASVLSPRGVSTCASPLTSERQVLMFHIKAYIEFMPLHADCRFVCYTSSHQSSSQTYARSLVLTVSLSISTPHRWFTFVHLSNAYLTWSSAMPFPLTLTTVTLNHSSLRWFETYALTSIPRGLPSSFVQHGLLTQSFLTHWSEA